MSATLHAFAGPLAASEAHDGHVPPDSGAAVCTTDGGAGLSAREWTVVAFMLLAVSWAAVGGFWAHEWVEAPVHQACRPIDVAVLP